MESNTLSAKITKQMWFGLIAIIVINVIGAYFNNPWVIAVFKPLITLGLVYYMFTMQQFFKLEMYRSLLVALLCGLLGDIALMPATKFDNSFLIGLVSFLVGHLAYMHVYKQLGLNFTLNWWKGGLLLVLLGWAAWMYLQLFPNIPGLEIPVFIYCLVLMLLAIFAIFGQSGEGYACRLMGVVVFIISDSSLAWGAFIQQSALLSAFVIATYGLAQMFMVFGIVRGIQPTEQA
jgi:uncharacterized membrane protein YhhN